MLRGSKSLNEGKRKRIMNKKRKLLKKESCEEEKGLKKEISQRN
jgi:hypothetical protein